MANMANMNFKANILPNTDLGYSLGSSDKRWNIYGILNSIKLTNENLDDLKTATSFYYAGGTNDVTGTPFSTNNIAFGLKVYRIAAGWYCQELMTPSGTVYRRKWNGDNSSWTTWEQLKYTDTTYSAGTGLSLSESTFSISKVPIANGGTNATTALEASTNLGFAYWGGRGTEIAANTDLNTLNETNGKLGTYYSSVSNRSKTLVNTPTTYSGYKLLSLGGYGDKRGHQIAWGTSPTPFVRTENGTAGTYSNWAKLIYKTEDIDTAVGSTSLPVYVSSDGQVKVITSYSGNSASATQIKVTNITPSSDTTYYPTFVSSTTTGNQDLRNNPRLYYWYNASTSASYLNIGNSSNSGGLTLHNANGKYADIITTAFTSNRTLTLPDKTGTIALTSDLPTQSITNGTVNRATYYSAINVLSAATNIYMTTDKISINKTSITDGYNLEVTGKTYLNSTTSATDANTSSQLVVANSNGGGVGIELWRGTSGSWQIHNNSNILTIRNNWTDSKQETYSLTGLKIWGSSGNIVLPHFVTIGQDTMNTRSTLSVNGSIYSSLNITSNQSIYTDRTGYGLYLKDNANQQYAGIYDNGANLWIGATSSDGMHHKGSLYLSVGHNGTTSNNGAYLSFPVFTDGTISGHSAKKIVYLTSVIDNQVMIADSTNGGIKNSGYTISDLQRLVSISQSGYTPQAPNDTNKYLRGDAIWAEVNKFTPIYLTNQDLNNYHGSDFTHYYAGGGNTVLNGPTDDLTHGGFGLTLYPTAGGWRIQDFVSAGGISYRRYWTGSAWGNWTKLEYTDTKYFAGTGLSLSGTTFNISKVPIANGGTDATTEAGARSKLKTAPTELLYYTEATLDTPVYVTLGGFNLTDTNNRWIYGTIKVHSHTNNNPSIIPFNFYWNKNNGGSIQGATYYDPTGSIESMSILVSTKDANNFRTAYLQIMRKYRFSIFYILCYGGWADNIHNNIATAASTTAPDPNNIDVTKTVEATQNKDILGNAATATKATQDGDGNIITSKYVTLDTYQTLTGVKNLPSGTSVYTEGAPMLYYRAGTNSNNQKLSTIYTSTNSINSKTVCKRLFFRHYSYDSTTGASIEQWDQYRLPEATPDKTSSNTYDILTNKSLITMEQGGTGNASGLLPNNRAAANVTLGISTWQPKTADQYKYVWGQKWSVSDFTYTKNDATSAITDTAHLSIWLSGSTTTNNLSANMLIDGKIYASEGFDGNATTATKLATARNIALSGAITGNANFDGSGDIIISTSVNHNHDSNYIKKSGDTVNGTLTMSGEYGFVGKMPRKKVDGGGWAYSPYRIIDNDNNIISNIGVLGSADTLTYTFIGSGNYSSDINLRIAPDGTVTAKQFSGPLTGNASSATQIYITRTTPESSTAYYPTFVNPSTTGNRDLRVNTNLYYWYNPTTTPHQSYLNIGGSENKGGITLHGGVGSNKYITLVPISTISGIRTITLPDKSGTMALISDLNAISLENGTDLNDLKTEATRFYYTSGGTNVSNSPFSDGDTFSLEVRRTASGYFVQRIMNISGNTVYRRYWNGGNSTWSDWVRDTVYSAGTGLVLNGATFSISKVPIANGGTNATTALEASTNLGFAYWGGRGTAIEANTDLNTLNETNGKLGTYYSGDSTRSATLINTPTSYSGYKLLALGGYRKAGGHQIAWGTSPTPFVRTENGTAGTYGSWAKIVYKTENVDTAVGSSSLPVYVSSDGQVKKCNTTLDVSITGNAATATKLKTARTISLTGSVTGSASFDGSANISISTSTNHNHDDRYVNVTGDTMTGQLNCNNHLMVYTATSGNAYNNGGSAIQVREVGGVGSAQSSWAYAPKIGFHWSGRVACQLGLDSSQYLTLYHNNSTNGGYFRAGELFTTNANGLRLAGGSGTTKSILLRNDGSNFWILCCNSVNAGDNWITPTCGGHPFHINLESGICYATKLYGAVWNDYAEYRKDNPNEKEIQEPGRCVHEVGDGSLTLTTKRLERGCEIISDTFGFAIGQDEENGYNTPIASNGRVLAYPYESIEEFSAHIGWPVCSGPNGTVSIMTEEEEEKYPSRIIGTISEIPTYEVWGTGNVQVNGRIWIRIR